MLQCDPGVQSDRVAVAAPSRQLFMGIRTRGIPVTFLCDVRALLLKVSMKPALMCRKKSVLFAAAADVRALDQSRRLISIDPRGISPPENLRMRTRCPMLSCLDAQMRAQSMIFS
jgi:hypothetical protein